MADLPTVSFGGLASGLDTNAIIRGLLEVERQPIQILQKKQNDSRSQLSLVQEINRKLQGLKTQAEALDTVREFEVLQATSSDASQVSATATSEATVGSYTLDNVVLALAQKGRSAAFAQKTDPIATGTLRITQGGTIYEITLDSSNATPEGLVAAINATPGLQVTASLFFDGSGYRVLLSANRTGTDAAFSVDESGLSGGTLPDFGGGATVQAARNASFTVDGLAVSSQSNTVTGVLPGVTFELKSEFASSPISISVSPDTEAIVSRVKEFVARYNEALGAIQAQFRYTGNGKPASSASLFGDSTLRAIQQRVTGLLTQAVPGLPANLQALSQVGVSLDKSGVLSLDESTLKSALKSDLRAVARIFASDSTTSPGTTGVLAQLVTELDTYLDPVTGLLKSKEDGINSRISDLLSQIDAMERRIERYEESLRRQFMTLETTLSQLQAQGNYLTQQLLRR
jgi:flagellar hook-associated protein 2